MSELYQNIRARRIELGLSQEELAQKMGYTSRSTIAKIEKGENDIPQSKIVAFAHALDTTPARLMGWVDPLDNAPESFYDRLEVLCKDKGISLEQMCRDTGLTADQLQEIKDKTLKELPVQTMLSISSYFEIAFPRILGDMDYEVVEEDGIEHSVLLINKKPVNYDELPEDKRFLIDYVFSCSDKQAEYIRQLVEAALLIGDE